MSVEQRNENARAFVSNKLSWCQENPITVEEAISYKTELNILENLIPIKANGFRGVVLTAIVGMQLDGNFDPCQDFYKCNPRSIFEKGIYYALKENFIPCGKSDPLNVAKNIQKLDIDWAKGRRPERAAKAAVEYLKHLVSARGTSKFEILENLFFKRLYAFGIEVSTYNKPISEDSLSDTPISIANKLSEFAIECSEGGANTQYIVGLLIAYSRMDSKYFSGVSGFNESVFGTNTTSKKPSDIWELNFQNEIENLYEITVKTIDYKRLDDCVSSLEFLAIKNKLVTFICNLNSDTKSLNLNCQSLNHGGISFQFLDISEFIKVTFCQLTESARRQYLLDFQSYVFSVNRAINTKNFWSEKFA